jgi:hypothetical protein
MPTTSSGSGQNDESSRTDSAQATIQPTENVLVLNPGESFSESIVVTIPAGPPIQNIKLVAVGATAQFVTFITPAGFGPLSRRSQVRRRQTSYDRSFRVLISPSPFAARPIARHSLRNPHGERRLTWCDDGQRIRW